MPEFTPDFLRTAAPKAGESMREWRDDQEKGLIFRATAGGDRRWSVRYVNEAGEHRRKTIGPFPLFGLAKARAEARVIKGSIAHKLDVVGRENDAKAAARRRQLSTLAGLAESYWLACELGTHVGGNARPKRASTIAGERRVFEKWVRPRFGDYPVADVRRVEVQDFVDRVSKRAKGTGRTCRDVIRQLLSFAVRQGLIEYNVGVGVGAVAAAPRERMLRDEELRRLWKAFSPHRDGGVEITPAIALACRLAMVTMARANEVLGMEWAEIDLKAKTWSLGADRMKGRRAHVFALSDLALDVLADARELLGGSEFVFPSQARGVTGESRMHSRSLSQAMRRVVGALKITPRATAHDFRRTGASNITGERIGIPRFIVSRILAHTDGGVTARHYDHHDYLGEKRRAMALWGALLRQIVEGGELASNVVMLKGR